MSLNDHNYWIYAFLTITFSCILLYLFKSNWIVISFYFMSCLYLALYFLVKLLVEYIVDRKNREENENLDCNIVECKNFNCEDDKQCINKKFCEWEDKKCSNEKKCKSLKEKKDKLNEKIEDKKKYILDRLNYYKIRGLNFKEHISYYIIILIITFFIYLFFIILIKGI